MMLECVVSITVPVEFLELPGVPLQLHVAKYNYDIGLKVDDEVQITDWQLLGETEQSFTFVGRVVNRFNQVIPGKPEDIFRISIWVEVGDKEDFPRLRQALTRLLPSDIKD